MLRLNSFWSHLVLRKGEESEMIISIGSVFVLDGTLVSNLKIRERLHSVDMAKWLICTLCNPQSHEKGDIKVFLWPLHLAVDINSASRSIVTSVDGRITNIFG